jgi:Putative beta-barrel porin-2, OmpL-like. bbp2
MMFSKRISRYFLAGVLASLATAASADPLGSPSMNGPLSSNVSPTQFDAGPLGTVYVTGAVSGMGMLQNNEAPGDKDAQVDLTNGQVFIQTTEGPVQFFLQVGAYSTPSLGLPYMKADKTTDALFGPVPLAYVKIAPTDNLSIQIGKLPTLIGAEYTFTFQNQNIERGLLWNQEPAVSRGVQVNYAQGPVSASVSWNDGYYSNRGNWISGLLSVAVTSSDVIAVAAGTSTSTSEKSSSATSLYLNNSEIYNLMYTHSGENYAITPYLQYSKVDADERLGLGRSGSTFGAAVLGRYSFNENWSLGGRAEYIKSSGSEEAGAPNLLYGNNSKAWSLTVTPTYQQGIFFARGELSYVKIEDATDGLAFGPEGLNTSQARAVAEIGFLF